MTLMCFSGRSAWSYLSGSMAAAALSSSLHNRRQNELQRSWVKERGHLWGSRSWFGCLNTRTWQHPMVAARDVACGDDCDAIQPGAKHLCAWRVRALRQVAGTAAAIDGVSARQREKEGAWLVGPTEFKNSKSNPNLLQIWFRPKTTIQASIILK
jgi:hypothetical protein